MLILMGWVLYGMMVNVLIVIVMRIIRRCLCLLRIIGRVLKFFCLLRILGLLFMVGRVLGICICLVLVKVIVLVLLFIMVLFICICVVDMCLIVVM